MSGPRRPGTNPSEKALEKSLLTVLTKLSSDWVNILKFTQSPIAMLGKR
jgi:hypothetical protein